MPIAALSGLLMILAVTAYFPFDWDPPRIVRNDVTRTSDGSLRFGEHNRAVTTGMPSWLGEARTSGVDIHLEVRPALEQSRPSASMMMLSRDYWHLDLGIGQEDADLVVWLHRPGSSDTGEPAFTVEGVLQPRRWTSVDVSVSDELRVNVNDILRLAEPLPADTLQSWGAGRVALGDELRSGEPWLGEIRHAEVRTGDSDVDYVHPGALSIPNKFLYVPEHLAPFPPPTWLEWGVLLAHFVSFVLVGVLLVLVRRPAPSVLPAILAAVGLAGVLAAGKFLFYGRHAAVADVVAQTAGALFGVSLARRARSNS